MQIIFKTLVDVLYVLYEHSPMCELQGEVCVDALYHVQFSHNMHSQIT